MEARTDLLVLEPTGEDEFTVAIAHEFFDALPIHIFEVSQPFAIPLSFTY